MTLIDSDRAHGLYAAMGSGVEMSGGSAANTMTGIASFGGRVGYIGKVADDQLGEVFGHDLRAVGVTFENAPALIGVSTGRCLIVVTPDAQRTMNTYLGASSLLSPDDVDPDLVGRRRGRVPRGLPLRPSPGQGGLLQGRRRCPAAGGRVSLTLSDSFCVDRHRDDFFRLVESAVDILFANEDELRRLYEVGRLRRCAPGRAGPL